MDFWADPSDKPKYFITVPYPYINGIPHVGHGVTFSRGEFLARYMRLKGYNVLWPQGWHATGGPIVGYAMRVREGDPDIIRILRQAKVPEEMIGEFGNPEKWVEYFPRQWKKAFEMAGFSIDWRREFYTTYLNPHYSKFVEWQYRKLREKGLIYQGSHPVVWDPKAQKVIGDHDRSDDYAGIQPVEAYIIKFRGKYVFPCVTLRPETVYGVTNLWINPEAEYVIARVDGEDWVVSKETVEEIRDQRHEVEVIKEVKGKDLAGEEVENPVTGEKVKVVPAEFVDPLMGTGIVMSVPAHAPYDYVAWRETREEWGLPDVKVIIEVEGMEVPAREIVEKMGIKSSMEKEKLEEATQKVYAKEFYHGIMKAGEWKGKRVQEVKGELVEEFEKRGILVRHYILPVRFRSRYGGLVHVKIIENQWFLKYSDPEWKEKAHRAVEMLRGVPEEIRDVLHRNIDWFRDWACTHSGELGTPLPWDPSQTVESLSDSTIYMAYYTIAHLIKKIPPERVGDYLFDYVFLGKGDPEEVAEKAGVDVSLIEEMRRNFEYFYPVDMRISAKDLLWNHLVFFIFHHTAIFPEDKWPRGIAINGYVLLNGEKMSKSKGNVIPLEDALAEHGREVVRFLLAYAANSGPDDANVELRIADKVREQIEEWERIIRENWGRGREDGGYLDLWMDREIDRTVLEVDREYWNLNNRNAVQKAFYEFGKKIKWYLRVTRPQRDVLKRALETWALLMYPVLPDPVEKMAGELGFEIRWPEIKGVPETADVMAYVEGLEEDYRRLEKLVGKPREVTIVVAAEWKYEVMEDVRGIIEAKAGIGEVLRRFRGEEQKVAERIFRNAEIVERTEGQSMELGVLEEIREYLEKEWGARIKVVREEECGDEKGKKALPGKPALIFSV